MKKQIINVKDMRNYLNLDKLEKEIRYLLDQYKEVRKMQLKRRENIKNKIEDLSEFKQSKYQDWFKQMDSEVKQLLEKKMKDKITNEGYK